MWESSPKHTVQQSRTAWPSPGSRETTGSATRGSHTLTHPADEESHLVTRLACAKWPGRGPGRRRRRRTVSAARDNLRGAVANVHATAPVDSINNGLVRLGAELGVAGALEVVDGEVATVVPGGEVAVLERRGAKRAALDAVRFFNLCGARNTAGGWVAGASVADGNGRGLNALGAACSATATARRTSFTRLSSPRFNSYTWSTPVARGYMPAATKRAEQGTHRVSNGV